MVIWSGFVICVLAQIIILFLVKAQYKQSEEYLAVKPGIQVWLVFIPSMVFGLLVDIEILVQCFTHKPTVFNTEPQGPRRVLLFIGVASLVASVSLILFSFLAFTPLVTPKQFLRWFFYCLIFKAVCWSPFIGLEYYDLIFENIYTDVKHQINPVKIPKKKVHQLRDSDEGSDEEEITQHNSSEVLKGSIKQPGLIQNHSDRSQTSVDVSDHDQLIIDESRSKTIK